MPFASVIHARISSVVSLLPTSSSGGRAAVGFGTTFPGRLPVIYRCLEPEDLWRLPLVLVPTDV